MSIFRPLLLAALTGIGCALGAAQAIAATPKLIGSFKDWDSFELIEGKAKTCYMRSGPIESKPSGVKRGEINLFVTHRPADKTLNEVSILTGYPYKPGSTATVTIGKAKFELFTDADSAWVERAKDEARLVAAMKAGANLTVAGTSARGTKTTDRYSLAGFSGAHQAINKACGVK